MRDDILSTDEIKEQRQGRIEPWGLCQRFKWLVLPGDVGVCQEKRSGRSKEMWPDHASPCVLRISISSWSLDGIIETQILEKWNYFTGFKKRDFKDDSLISTLTPSGCTCVIPFSTVRQEAGLLSQCCDLRARTPDVKMPSAGECIIHTFLRWHSEVGGPTGLIKSRDAKEENLESRVD